VLGKRGGFVNTTQTKIEIRVESKENKRKGQKVTPKLSCVFGEREAERAVAKLEEKKFCYKRKRFPSTEEY